MYSIMLSIFIDLDEIEEDIKKRKHVKNPFEDKYLNVVLSSFDQVRIFDYNNNQSTTAEDDYTLNVAINVSLRSEIIVQMQKSLEKEVEKALSIHLPNKFDSNVGTQTHTTEKKETLNDSSHLEIYEIYKKIQRNEMTIQLKDLQMNKKKSHRRKDENLLQSNDDEQLYNIFSKRFISYYQLL